VLEEPHEKARNYRNNSHWQHDALVGPFVSPFLERDSRFRSHWIRRMRGSVGRRRPRASQAWRAEVHGVAPLALLATKSRGCVAKDHYQSRASEGASHRIEALALLK
jgi:hypothetical protein